MRDTENICPSCQRDEHEFMGGDSIDTDASMYLQKIIIESFKDYGAMEYRINPKSIFIKGIYEDVPENKFSSAINSYANNINIQDIILYIDSTLRGDAKYGMILTKDTLYYRSKNSKDANSIKIKDIRDVKAQSKFFGNKFDIIDSNGNVHQLGQITALKKQLLAIEESFKTFINQIVTFLA